MIYLVELSYYHGVANGFVRIVSPDEEGSATIPYALQPASQPQWHSRWDRPAVVDADRAPDDPFGFADMLLHFANATDSMTTTT